MCHLEDPGVFIKNSVIKSKLNIMWKANRTACVSFSSNEFIKCLPQLWKKCLAEKGLPLKVLVIDSLPAQPPDLQDRIE